MVRIPITISLISLLLLTCSAEKSLFKKAKETNTIEGFKDYLSKYENGKYATEAKQKIADIKFSQVRDSVFSSFIKNLNSNISNDASILIKPLNKVLMGTPIKPTIIATICTGRYPSVSLKNSLIIFLSV